MKALIVCFITSLFLLGCTTPDPTYEVKKYTYQAISENQIILKEAGLLKSDLITIPYAIEIELYAEGDVIYVKCFSDGTYEAIFAKTPTTTTVTTTTTTEPPTTEEVTTNESI